MKTAFVLVAVLCMPALAFSATIYVPDDYATIQLAIDDSVNWDTIIVRPGTYVENIDFKGKKIKLQSEFGPDATVIDGNQMGSVVTCQSGEQPGTVLKGFTITNGKYDHSFKGGGMYNWQSSPTVTRCIFYYNYGSGMDNENSSPTVTHCIFAENGIGISFDNSSITVFTVTHSTFSKNGGGGMEGWNGSVVVDHCYFYKNTGWGGYGGGMDCVIQDGTVTHCIFEENGANWGGGISAWALNFKVTHCDFYNNSAYEGGGIDSCTTVSNCTFYGNSAQQGGAIGVSDQVTNCTFYGNTAQSGGGIYDGGTVTNCILWENQPDQITSGSVNYCCVQGGYPGTGNIDSDPLFVDPNNGDFHLLYTSPCRDTGDNSAVTDPYDFEGDPRIAYSTVDMGADEFYTHLYCIGQFTPGGRIYGKLVGLPGTSPTSLLFGSGVLDPPLPTMWGNFHLQAPWLMIPLVPIPGDGVLVLPATIPATPPAPYDLPMQALIGLNPDSLTNLYRLEVR
jgi:hypothetical protein